MKQMEQQQRQKNQQVAAVVAAGNGSVSQRKRTTFSKLRQKQGGGDSSGFIEMKEFPRSKSKDNTATKYQKQGLGGYEDEEADYSEINLDVNMK